jgi:hypothetical protein
MSAAADVRVSGDASTEEVAVVVAALSARSNAAALEVSAYERWRQGRLAALRRTLRPSVR